MTLPAAFLARPLAHRGLHDARIGRIENGMSAFRAAAEAGFGIELDVQLSRDGVAMVHHDVALDRLTDRSGPVHGLTAEELSRVRLGHTEDRIATLTTVLDGIGDRVPVLIEIKADGGGDIAAAVAEAVEGRGGVAVMSFAPHCIARMADLAPRVPRGLTTCAFDGPHAPSDPKMRARLAAIADYEAVGACFVSHDHADLHNPRLAELKARGAAILCWTVRTPEAEHAARRIADNITFEGYLPDRDA